MPLTRIELVSTVPETATLSIKLQGRFSPYLATLLLRRVQDSNLCRVTPLVFETNAIGRYANPPYFLVHPPRFELGSTAPQAATLSIELRVLLHPVLYQINFEEASLQTNWPLYQVLKEVLLRVPNKYQEPF